MSYGFSSPLASKAAFVARICIAKSGMAPHAALVLSECCTSQLALSMRKQYLFQSREESASRIDKERMHRWVGVCCQHRAQ